MPGPVSSGCPHCGAVLVESPEHAGSCPRCRRTLGESRVADDAPTRLAPSSGRVGSAATDVAAARNDPRRRFGHFTLLAELGRGGMGTVHRAWDERLGRAVALKTLLGVADGDAVERFRREAEALGRLRHPNIVSVHETGETDGTPWLVMDLVAGTSLRRRVLGEGGEKLPLEKGVEVVRDVARAVQHAHDQGVLHRDLKPENLLIDEQGCPRVLDFGLARVRTDGERSRLTKTGMALGTPAYMPPEQTGGAGRIDERSDVYSLGATLYFVLTGKPPFEGATDVNVIAAVLRKDPVPPSLSNVRAAGDLETICLRCLEKDPAMRYATAAELADDLERHLAGEPIVAKPPTRLERTIRGLSRHRTAVALVAASAIALVIALESGPIRRRCEERRSRQAIAALLDDATAIDPAKPVRTEAVEEMRSRLAALSKVRPEDTKDAVDRIERVLQTLELCARLDDQDAESAFAAGRELFQRRELRPLDRMLEALERSVAADGSRAGPAFETELDSLVVLGKEAQWPRMIRALLSIALLGRGDGTTERLEKARRRTEPALFDATLATWVNEARARRTPAEADALAGFVASATLVVQSGPASKQIRDSAARLLLERAERARSLDPTSAIDDRIRAFELAPASGTPAWYPGFLVRLMMREVRERDLPMELAQERDWGPSDQLVLEVFAEGADAGLDYTTLATLNAGLSYQSQFDIGKQRRARAYRALLGAAVRVRTAVWEAPYGLDDTSRADADLWKETAARYVPLVRALEMRRPLSNVAVEPPSDEDPTNEHLLAMTRQFSALTADKADALFPRALDTARRRLAATEEAARQAPQDPDLALSVDIARRRVADVYEAWAFLVWQVVEQNPRFREKNSKAPELWPQVRKALTESAIERAREGVAICPPGDEFHALTLHGRLVRLLVNSGDLTSARAHYDSLAMTDAFKALGARVLGAKSAKWENTCYREIMSGFRDE